MIVKFQIEKFIENSFCKINAKVESRFFCNSIEAILYSILAISHQGELSQAPTFPFLLGRRYHLTRVSACASRKYFFQIGRKREMNVD